MFKRELRYNFKNFIMWFGILCAMFLMVFLVYPSITSGMNTDAFEQIMAAFPKELLKAFNMDLTAITSVFGWYKTEGLVLFLLLGSIYSALLGINILSKEESNKTIEFLYSKPISRKRIVTSKLLSGLLYVTALVIGTSLFNLAGFAINGEVEIGLFLSLSLSPVLTFYPIYFICFLIGVLIKRPKKIYGIGIAFVMISYFMQLIGDMSDKVKIIKYFSVFTLTPIRDIINSSSFNIIYLIISVLICFVATILIYYFYNKKELV